MRPTLMLLVLCLSTTAATAQEQERKLMDRVLKPNMTLENSAQNKQFNVRGDSAPTKPVRTKMFQFLNRNPAKQYGGVLKVETKNFQASTSPDQDRRASLATRNAPPEHQKAYDTANYAGVRTASEARQSVDSSEFNDSSRAFLVRGKSQKALSAQDRPMTIDEVRELLNKNK